MRVMPSSLLILALVISRYEFLDPQPYPFVALNKPDPFPKFNCLNNGPEWEWFVNTTGDADYDFRKQNISYLFFKPYGDRWWPVPPCSKEIYVEVVSSGHYWQIMVNSSAVCFVNGPPNVTITNQDYFYNVSICGSWGPGFPYKEGVSNVRHYSTNCDYEPRFAWCGPKMNDDFYYGLAISTTDIGNRTTGQIHLDRFQQYRHYPGNDRYDKFFPNAFHSAIPIFGCCGFAWIIWDNQVWLPRAFVNTTNAFVYANQQDYAKVTEWTHVHRKYDGYETLQNVGPYNIFYVDGNVLYDVDENDTDTSFNVTLDVNKLYQFPLLGPGSIFHGWYSDLELGRSWLLNFVNKSDCLVSPHFNMFCTSGCNYTLIDGVVYNGDVCSDSCYTICGVDYDTTMCLNCGTSYLIYWFSKHLKLVVIMFFSFMSFMLTVLFLIFCFKCFCARGKWGLYYKGKYTHNIFLITLIVILTCGRRMPGHAINISPVDWNQEHTNGHSSLTVFSAYSQYVCRDIGRLCSDWESVATTYYDCCTTDIDPSQKCHDGNSLRRGVSFFGHGNGGGWPTCFCILGNSYGGCCKHPCNKQFILYQCTRGYDYIFDFLFKTNGTATYYDNYNKTSYPGVEITGCSSSQIPLFMIGEDKIPRDPFGCVHTTDGFPKDLTNANLWVSDDGIHLECFPPPNCNAEFLAIEGDFSKVRSGLLRVPMTCDFAFGFSKNDIADNCSFTIKNCYKSATQTTCLLQSDELCFQNGLRYDHWQPKMVKCYSCCYNGTCYKGVPEHDYTPSAGADSNTDVSADLGGLLGFFSSGGKYVIMIVVVAFVIMICLFLFMICCFRAK